MPTVHRLPWTPFIRLSLPDPDTSGRKAFVDVNYSPNGVSKTCIFDGDTRRVAWLFVIGWERVEAV